MKPMVLEEGEGDKGRKMKETRGAEISLEGGGRERSKRTSAREGVRVWGRSK